MIVRGSRGSLSGIHDSEGGVEKNAMRNPNRRAEVPDGRRAPIIRLAGNETEFGRPPVPAAGTNDKAFDGVRCWGGDELSEVIVVGIERGLAQAEVVIVSKADRASREFFDLSGGIAPRRAGVFCHIHQHQRKKRNDRRGDEQLDERKSVRWKGACRQMVQRGLVFTSCRFGSPSWKGFARRCRFSAPWARQ